MTVEDLTDPELREDLAMAAYYKERFYDMVGDREISPELEEAQYFCLRWEQLAAHAQRPYRLGVDVALDHVKELVAA